MINSARTSCEGDGKGRTVRELLPIRKYSIDYYELEYTGRRKPVAAPRDDLAGKFFWSPDFSASQAAR